MKKRKTVTLFLTHCCNLKCTYCYEIHKDNKKMTFETAKKIIDYEFTHNDGYDEIEFDLFGGEPFLEFELIKKITEYIKSTTYNVPYIIFSTTNGTLVHGEIQDWLKENINCYQCALSLDGPKEFHDMNRTGSFNKIDLDFFKNTYPNQPVKMTISAETLPHLYECITFVHNYGFKLSCNLAFNIDWSNKDNEKILIRELEKLCDYYISHPEIEVCTLLNKKIELAGYDKKDNTITNKWCGTGTDMPTYDIDGEKYGCQFFAPISIGKENAQKMQKQEWKRNIDTNLLDEKCKNCPVIDLCPTCYGANYASTGSIYKRDINACKLTKLTIKSAAVLKAMQWNAGQLKDYTGDKEQALLRGIVKIDEME